MTERLTPPELGAAAPDDASSAQPLSSPPPPPPPSSHASDPTLYFDRQSHTWRRERHDTGEELEWDPQRRAWLAVVDEDLIKKQQAAYSVEGVDEEAPAAPVQRRGKKRKQTSPGTTSASPATAPTAATAASSSSSSSSHPPSATTSQASRVTTSVFVSGLPSDTQLSELAQVFSRYGVLNEDDDGKPRIKLYYRRPPVGNGSSSSSSAKAAAKADGEGEEERGRGEDNFKGEALVTYFRPESVDLAVRLLDETCLRAHLGQREPLMRVQRAEFGRSNQTAGGGGGGGGGVAAKVATRSDEAPSTSGSGGVTAAAPDAPADEAGAALRGEAATAKKPRGEQDRRKAKKRQVKMQSRLTEWDDDDNFGPADDEPADGSSGGDASAAAAAATLGDATARLPPRASERARTVVLRRMFTLAELDEDPRLLLELKEDVRDECENLGRVTNCVLYDKEPDGIMSVKFSDPLSARACVAKMDGRWFGGRRVVAYLVDGRPKFKRSLNVEDEGADEEEEGEEAEGREGGEQQEGRRRSGAQEATAGGATASNGAKASKEKQRLDSFGSWLEAGGDDD